MAITRISGANAISGAVPTATTATSLNDGTSSKSKVAFHRWKLTSAFTASTGVNLITGSFTEQTSVGTSMSYSSGIWTFPYTGQWQIVGNIVGQSASSSSYRGLVVSATTNNSSYSYLVSGYTGQDASHYYMSAYYSAMFDVTDVSNCKIKVSTEMQATGGVGPETWVEFFYLGDT